MKRALIRKWKRSSLRAWIQCRMKRCDYYRHYLAYGPPDLTHEGFHAAEVKCAEAQQRFTEWLNAHPDNDRIPTWIDEQANFWERQVRA